MNIAWRESCREDATTCMPVLKMKSLGVFDLAIPGRDGLLVYPTIFLIDMEGLHRRTSEHFAC